MDFSEREITDLAVFFAKRFPSYEQRAALSEAAGLAGEAQLTGDARSAWTDVVRVAVQKNRLNELVERAQQQRPDDENLREMATVIRSGRRWRKRRWGAVIGVGMVTVGAVLVWSPWSGEPTLTVDPVTSGDALASAEPIEPEPAAPEPEPAAPEPEPAPPEPEPEPGDGDESHAGGEGYFAPSAPEAEDERSGALEPEIELPASTPAPVPGTPGSRGRCSGEPGEVVGYWFAGEQSPGAVGETYTVDGGINVRADYPSSKNGFQLAPAVCALGHGWSVRIGLEPIFISGGAYWVPLRADDIMGR